MANSATAGRRRPRKAQQHAIETALAALAHEVRTPLTGILALSELLCASNLGTHEREWAASIHGAARHLAELTTVVVEGVKAGAGGIILQRERFSPRLFAETVAAALAGRAQAKGLAAHTAIAADLPALVIGDPVRLRAAVENLIDNAVKFTPRGHVGFSAGWAAGPRGRVTLVFTVEDSGVGLTPAQIKRLFRPFGQASAASARRFGGAGLGLVLAKRIAEAMEGELSVTSRRGAGTTFCLTATVRRAQARPARNGDNGSSEPAALGLRVLCVEDNPYGRVVLNTMLSELGHRADFADSGEAAVAAAGGHDVILMDMILPGALDGAAAARRIRAGGGHGARVPIIGMSGRSEPAAAAAARAAGMTGYLVKPLSPRTLAQALSAAMQSAAPSAAAATGARAKSASKRGKDVQAAMRSDAKKAGQERRPRRPRPVTR